MKIKTANNTGSILVVDDTLDNLRLLTQLLKDHGYRVRAAKTGSEAIESVKAEKPDLLLLDIKLPDQSGFEVCKILKEADETKDIPVIFLSVLDSTSDKLSAFEAGGIDYITKPFIPIEVLFRVKNHLEISHLRSQLEKQSAELQLKNDQLQKEIDQSRLSADELMRSYAKLEESKTASINILEDLKAEIILREGTEEKIRETNEYLTNLINYANAPIIVWDTSLIITRFNHAFERLSGYLEKEVLGKKIDILFSEDKTEYSLDLIKRAVAGEFWQTVEIGIYRKDGASRIVLWNSANILDKDGKTVIATIAQGNDITESKHASEILRESEDKFKYVFDHSVIGKSLTLITGEINVNQAFCDMMGYQPEELKKKKWQEISHPDDIEMTQNCIDSLVSGEKNTVRFTKRYIHKNGSVIWADLATSLRRDYNGKPLYFMTAVNNITEQKNAEELLMLSNQRVALHLKRTPLAVIEFDTEGIVTGWNPAAVEIFGFSLVEAIGQHWTFMVPKDVWSMLDGVWEGLMSQVGGSRSTNDNITKDNRRINCEWYSTPLVNSDGVTLGVASLVMDVTDRKQAEEKLSLLALRQEAILSSVPDIIMEVDKNKIYTWSNKTGFNFFGEDIIGREASYYFEGEQDTYKNVQPLFDGDNNIIYLESWQRRKDGQKRLLGWWCRVLKDEDENVTGAISTARDITESRQLTLLIEEERNKLASLLSSIPDEVWYADKDKKFTLANPKALKEFGLTSTENLDIEKFAESLEVFLADGTPRPVELAPPLRALKGEVVKNFEELVLIPEIKELRHRQVNAAPVKDEAGNIIGAISVVRDITELKAAESQIRKLNEELEERVVSRTAQLEAANKELEAFCYSVSHDLRAPLRSIHSFTNILVEDYQNSLDDEAKRLFGIVSSSAIKMGELIDDLLRFSKIGRSNLSSSILDMKPIIRTVFEELAGEKIKSRTVFKIEKLHKATGDEGLMRQVWSNLISNAIKYSSKVDISRISISSGQRGDMITYSIKDNGVGFDMLYKHKLFGVFQRLHSEKEFEGNGVGLAIVQRIIIRHGGKVWAEGEVGKGAVFYFTLPAIASSQ
jgi:PAS domain S-box-containing protein